MWLEANDGRNVLLPYEDFMDKLESVFGMKRDTLELRRESEKRKWMGGERLAENVRAKIFVAAPLNIEGEETITFIIDGVDDDGVQMQMKLAKFRFSKGITRHNSNNSFRTLSYRCRST